jgi:uncharacterized phage-associated protein
MARAIKGKGQKHARVPQDVAKFKETVLWFARRSEIDPTFGAIKLNKLLFYADFLAYAQLGKSITGMEYFALPQGPAPKYMVPIRDQMLRAGEIAIRKSEMYRGVQERTLALREPKLKEFTAQEVDVLSYVLQQCGRMSAKELSAWTHTFCGWEVAQLKETIPYSVALVGNREPTENEVKRGLELETTAEAALAKYAAPHA